MAGRTNRNGAAAAALAAACAAPSCLLLPSSPFAATGLAGLTVAFAVAVGIGAPLVAAQWGAPAAARPGVRWAERAGDAWALTAAAAALGGWAAATGPAAIALAVLVWGVAYRGTGRALAPAIGVAMVSLGVACVASARPWAALDAGWIGPWTLLLPAQDGWTSAVAAGMTLGVLGVGAAGPRWAGAPGPRQARRLPVAIAGAALLASLAALLTTAWAVEWTAAVPAGPAPLAAVAGLALGGCAAAAGLAPSQHPRRDAWLGALATAWFAGPAAGALPWVWAVVPALALLAAAWRTPGRAAPALAATAAAGALVLAPPLPAAAWDAAAAAWTLVGIGWGVAWTAAPTEEP
jgi:hypothetical protein